MPACEPEPVIVLATVGWRADILPEVVNSLQGQGRLLLLLDRGAESLPGVESKQVPEHLRGCGSWARLLPWWHEGLSQETPIILCDDDFIYPPDYVAKTLRALKKHESDGPCLLSWNGYTATEPPRYIRWDAEERQAQLAVEVGIGTSAFRLKTLAGIETYNLQCWHTDPARADGLLSFHCWRTGVRLLRPEGTSGLTLLPQGLAPESVYQNRGSIGLHFEYLRQQGWPGAALRTPRVHALLREHGLDPWAWTGTYELCVAGKLGEVLMSLGLFQGLRYLLPQAKLVWRVAREYHTVFNTVTTQPNGIVEYPLPQTTEDLAIRVAAAKNEGRYPSSVQYDAELDRLTVDLRAWCLSKESILRSFANMAGLHRNAWRRPLPRVQYVRGNIALALPTGTPSVRWRKLDLQAKTWETLARLAREKGLIPISNSRPEDVGFLPEMPGWTQLHEPNLQMLLQVLLPNAQWCIGLNTGATWAHMILGPATAKLSMADSQNLPALWFHNAPSAAIDANRHHQLVWNKRQPANLDDWALAEAEWALR